MFLSYLLIFFFPFYLFFSFTFKFFIYCIRYVYQFSILCLHISFLLKILFLMFSFLIFFLPYFIIKKYNSLFNRFWSTSSFLWCIGSSKRACRWRPRSIEIPLNQPTTNSPSLFHGFEAALRASELDDPRAIIDSLEDLRYRDYWTNRIGLISRKNFKHLALISRISF